MQLRAFSLLLSQRKHCYVAESTATRRQRCSVTRSHCLADLLSLCSLGSAHRRKEGFDSLSGSSLPPLPSALLNSHELPLLLKQIKQDGLTDSQREKAYLDGLFNAAKDEGAEEEEEHPVRNVHTIVDDDDW